MNAPLIKAHLDHRRIWKDFIYAYPVISRRSRGASLGINLNPDKVCNFDCVYCEVDRVSPPRKRDVDLSQLEQEVESLLDLIICGELFNIPPFDSARPDQRRLNDIAFSGDGEPTLCPLFPEVIESMNRLLDKKGLADVKLVLITNATRLQDTKVQAGLEKMMGPQGANPARGEIWAKLDAGTSAHYQSVNRSGVTFERILDNLLATSRRWPTIIQTLLFEWEGHGPTPLEMEAYFGHIEHLLKEGGHVKGIQLYTIARPTPEAAARPLKAAAMDDWAQAMRQRFPEMPLDVFYGPEH